MQMTPFFIAHRPISQSRLPKTFLELSPPNQSVPKMPYIYSKIGWQEKDQLLCNCAKGE